MGIRLQELLKLEKNKEKLLILLESRGEIIKFDKKLLHQQIHKDLIFFFNLIRIYCFKNAQVGNNIKITDLFNKIGENISNYDKNSYLKVFVKDVNENIIEKKEQINNNKVKKVNSIEQDIEDYTPDPLFDYKITTLLEEKKNIQKNKNINNIKEEYINIEAKYIITSNFKRNIIEESSLYNLSAYSEENLIKEIPKYFPNNSLEYNDLLREKRLSKINSLLESNDPKDTNIYFKIMGEIDTNSKYKEQLQKTNINLRDENYNNLLRDLDEISANWEHYSFEGGLTFEEQNQDQEQIYKTMLEKIVDPIEKKETIKLIEHMKLLYNWNHNKKK